MLRFRLTSQNLYPSFSVLWVSLLLIPVTWAPKKSEKVIRTHQSIDIPFVLINSCGEIQISDGIEDRHAIEMKQLSENIMSWSEIEIPRSRRVIIKAEKETAFGLVEPVLDALKEHGFENLMFLTGKMSGFDCDNQN